MKYLALADIHLMQEKPVCRLQSEDWNMVMENKFRFLSEVCKAEKVDSVIIAGDIFDSWNKVSIELLNVAIRLFSMLKESTLQKCILTIPGNHDSMYGNYDELYRAPYHTLVSVGIFTEIENQKGISKYLYNGKGKLDTSAKIVVAHKGLYLKEKPFPTAPESGNVEAFVRDCLPDTCRLLIAGDYHKPFITDVGRCKVVNCGSLFRLRADQIDYKPEVQVITVDDDVENVSIESFTVPLLNAIRRDYIDDCNEELARLEELVGGISGDFEVSSNYATNFYSLTAELENRKSLNMLFERTLTLKKE